ncbi:MAG: beta-lactamase family protein [Anaerolineales bacterium]|nr:beta-lactamase family protein [Anaerolineales bacterium]
MDKDDNRLLVGETGKDLDAVLTPFLEHTLETHQLPGLAIGVVAENEIVYARSFGVKSLVTQEPVNLRTLFHMASVSKPFVASAVMQWVERGRMQLEAPLITYLPYFKLDDDRYPEITLQQMLSHVSGMPDVEDYEWDRPQYDEGALERYVRSLSSEKMLSNPGEKFAYSNMAFECLGDVIAKVAGMSFDDYEKKHILDPAGMVESTFLKPAHLPENWAAPHVRLLENLAWEGYPYNRMHAPSSTLHSNALEMCNWAIANLNQGNYQGKHILRTDSYDLLWKPWADTGDGRQVGLSWFFQETRGHTIIQHGGGDTGFRSHFVMLPDLGAAVVVLCNVIPAPAEEIALAALELLLGDPPTPLIPDASLLVGKTLQQQGLAAAVAHWNSLQSDHPDEYNFSGEQFYPLLFEGMMMKREPEARLLAQLCAQILPEPELKVVEKIMGHFQKKSA